MADIRAFVCGHPVAHSRSPLIHGHWLSALGIAGSYERIDIDSADIRSFISNLRRSGYAGGNVTMPHKEAAFRLAARKDAAAEQIGAVNTLWLEDGILCGSNSDAYGFAANLDERAPGWDRAGVAVVLGAGGAARAVVHALLERGIGEVRILNRTKARAQDLSDTFGRKVSAHDLSGAAELVADAGLVLNTTAPGMGRGRRLPAAPAKMGEGTLITDIVYVPLETPFLAAARRRGLKTVDGLGMLLHQAVPGFERWFGVRPSVTDELRQRVLASLKDHR